MRNILEKGLREYDYETVCGGIPDKEYPKSFDLNISTTVKQQQLNGKEIWACAACAIATIAEQIWGKEFSEGWAYAKFRSDSYNKKGLYLSVALEMWRKIGIVPLADFGTLVEMPEIKRIVSEFPELLGIAVNHTIAGYASLDYADKTKKDKAIKDALTKPGAFGLLACSENYFGSNHAFVITGWDDDSDMYIYQNSYGYKFGEKGKGKIPKSEVDAVYAIFVEDFELPFKDIPKDHWCYNHVKNLYFSGIINGVTPDTIEGDRPITRYEAFALEDRVLSKIEKMIIRIYQQMNERDD